MSFLSQGWTHSLANVMKDKRAVKDFHPAVKGDRRAIRHETLYLYLSLIALAFGNVEPYISEER